jgi:hypothetical protein
MPWSLVRFQHAPPTMVLTMNSKIGIYTPIAVASPGEEIEVLIGHFLQCLFLFDVVCIDSIRLKEVPRLIEILGYKNFRLLIENHSVEFYCDPCTTINLNETRGAKRKLEGGFAFKTGAIDIADRKLYIHHCLTSLLPVANQLKKREYQSFKLLMAENIHQRPRGKVGGNEAAMLNEDLEKHHFLVENTIKRKAKNKFQELSPTSINQIEISIEKRGEDNYAIANNLIKIIPSLTPEIEFDLLNRSILEIAGLEKALFLRRELGMPVQIEEKQSDLIEWKCRDLARFVTGDRKIEKFQKILQVKGLPLFEDALKTGQLNIDKFLDIRKSDEALAFRQMFFSDENIDPEELCRKAEEKINKLKLVIDSTKAKIIRFSAATGIGIVNPLLGIAAGIADFAVGLKIKADPVLCFLDEKLPSVFSAHGK